MVKFNRHCALPSTARVYVRIEAEPGETVYILTGNKELGYKEHAQVEACGQNLVVFETDRLVDYTISKTDIVSAQEAMENIFARNYDMDDQP